METFDFLTDYYNSYNEDDRLQSRHGSVEFLTTMRYIEKYLKLGSRIIEIGAGTGRYSHVLARSGYIVDSVELIDHNIEVFNNNTLPDEKITVTQGNAMDLAGFADNFYDITLLLGPMYHLFTTEEKKKALSEALRVTKKGGIVFVAYCIADISVITFGFMGGNVFSLIDEGLLDENFKASSRPSMLFELHRKEDIDRLMKDFGVTRLHYVASDGYTNHMRETVDNMDDRTFELYLKYHFSICERPDMVGLTHHSLDIFRKN